MILESTIILDFGLDEMYNKYLCFYLIALTFKSLLFMLITLLQNYFISCYSSKLLQGRILFSSVAQSCLTLCHPMDCSMPGFPVLHHFPELAQTHVHWSFPGGSVSKESTCNVGDLSLISGLGRSLGGGHGKTLQYFAWRIL